MSASIQRSREAILSTIGSPSDLTLVQCGSGPEAELAAAGARGLLAGLDVRELDLESLAGARGDLAALVGGSFGRDGGELAARALAVAELRFRHVLVLPTMIDPGDDAVARALGSTAATVFASDPESQRRLAAICETRLAHDCAFFFDYSPYVDDGAGELDDASLDASELAPWLRQIAAHERVRTGRPRVMIAAALMGKQVEYPRAESSDWLAALAEYALGDRAVTAVTVPLDPDRLEPAMLDAATAETLARLTELAGATPVPETPRSAGCRVTAVILTQGRIRLLRRALDSLASGQVEVRTIVVDNNSGPALAADVRALCEQSGAELHRSERNLGVAGGRNLGISLANADYVLLLDDDAELLPGALAHLVSVLDEHAEVDAVTATVVRPDGTIIHSGGEMTVTDELASFELLDDGRPITDTVPPPSGESGWLPHGACMARREVYERCPLDERMSTYFEDNEWSYRASREHGRRFYRSREALVLHHLADKHRAAPDFKSKAEIVRLFAAYARFYERHSLLLGPWLFDHVPELRSVGGSYDLAGARVLMELALAKGSDWILMAWLNGDLEGVLTGRTLTVDQRATAEALVASRADVTRWQTETQRLADSHRRQVDQLRARSAQDAHTISSLDAALNAANHRLRRVEGSVTWQMFQRTRGRVFGLLGGEDSHAVELLQGSLRGLGGRLRMNGAQDPRRPAPLAGRRSGRKSSGPIVLPSSAEPVASIVIPLYARADLTREALASIRDYTEHVPYEVILVDDAADSSTKALLKQVSGARVLANETNIGYLRSVQRGAAEARGRWLVLCNNDIEVEPGWLSALLDCGESRPDVAVVAPKYLYPDGSLAEAGGVIWRDGTGANYGRGQDPSACHYGFRREIDYGSAAALLVRTDFWNEVGGFDERFLPMYYEDTDLCFEARARGLRVLYEPRSRVIHFEGSTAGTDESSGHKRNQQLNRPKFVDKWRGRLDAEHLDPEHADQWLGANLRHSRRVLVVDHRMPQWDRESGALRMRGILEALLELDCHVVFLPDNLLAMQPYTRELQRLGVEVLYGVELPQELIRIAPTLSLAILSRPQVAARWLNVIREHGEDAVIAYDTVDLHWLREARQAAAADGAEAGELVLTPKVNTMRQLELGLIRASDATIVVSDEERTHVLNDVPEATVHVVPNVNPVRESVPPGDRRSGVLFVGGFEHPPNTEAALVLVNEVMPHVWRELPDVHVTIVGTKPPPEVTALAGPRVRIAGWIADLDPVIDSARALVAPLTYGAGLKGKVTQALAAGLPVVTTPIGAEGLDAVDGEQMLIGDDPSQLAERVVRVLTDAELWRRLSRAGQELATERCSPQVMSERLQMLLDTTPLLHVPERARQSG